MAVSQASRTAAAQSRDLRLQALGFEDLGDYYRSATWHRVKAAYRRSDLPQDCLLCGTSDDIDLHHATYERVGEEELSDLIPLCGGCHSVVHVLASRGDLAGLDRPSIGVLVDEERAKRNREQQQLRRREARVEHLRDRDRRKARNSRGRRLELAQQRARLTDADLTEELAVIDAAIASIEDKLGIAPPVVDTRPRGIH